MKEVRSAWFWPSSINHIFLMTVNIKMHNKTMIYIRKIIFFNSLYLCLNRSFNRYRWIFFLQRKIIGNYKIYDKNLKWIYINYIEYIKIPSKVSSFHNPIHLEITRYLYQSSSCIIQSHLWCINLFACIVKLNIVKRFS